MEPIRDAYAKTPLGEILILDGMNPVKRWDGLLPAPVDAGLIAPATACTITKGSDPGQVIGYFRAYVRWVDSRGNISHLSPISNTELCEGPSGSVTGATNTSPIRITTSGAHGLASGDIVRVEGTTGNTGCIATWEITVVDADEFDLNFSAGDGAYTGGGTWTAGVDMIEYTDVPVPTDPKVVRKQILRNTDGQFTTFYVDVDTTDLAGTSFSTDNTDEDLGFTTGIPLLTGLPRGARRLVARHAALLNSASRNLAGTWSNTTFVSKRSACLSMRSISAGPIRPSTSPGQLSTSVVVVSWPPCCKPVISTGLRLARAA